MALAGMLSADCDALICDFAETYGILNIRALPVSLLATLAVGLREDSRIKMNLSGSKANKSEMLLAAAVDRLSLLVWAQTEDGRNGVNPPKSVLDSIVGAEKTDSLVVAFESGDEFEIEWAQITGVSHGN